VPYDVAAATAAITAADPKLAAFVRRSGPYEHRPGDGDALASLARAIVFQQLAGRAAAAIHRRFVEAIGGSVTAAAILATDPERLRGAGLSAAKTASLIDLATKVTDGTVPLAELGGLDDDAIVERTNPIHRSDALRQPANDAGLSDARGADEARAIALAFGEDVERLLDFRVAADHGVELAHFRGSREILAERRERRKLLRVEREPRLRRERSTQTRRRRARFLRRDRRRLVRRLVGLRGRLGHEGRLR